MIRNAGFTVKNAPSIDHPIPVSVFYRNNRDGSVSWFWPKGNKETAMCKFEGMSRILFSAGFEGLLAHGRLVVYADLPTATSLQHQSIKASLN